MEQVLPLRPYVTFLAIRCKGEPTTTKPRKEKWGSRGGWVNISCTISDSSLSDDTFWTFVGVREVMYRSRIFGDSAGFEPSVLDTWPNYRVSAMPGILSSPPLDFPQFRPGSRLPKRFNDGCAIAISHMSMGFDSRYVPSRWGRQ